MIPQYNQPYYSQRPQGKEHNYFFYYCGIETINQLHYTKPICNRNFKSIAYTITDNSLLQKVVPASKRWMDYRLQAFVRL